MLLNNRFSPDLAEQVVLCPVGYQGNIYGYHIVHKYKEKGRECRHLTSCNHQS